MVFVASENEVLKGFISGEIKYKEYRVYNKEGYVGDWFVENAYQGQGIGKALFDMLVKEFIKANCTHIALDTHLENEKAIKIYEDRGFIKRLVTFFKPLKDLS
ncbi:MAG: Ribosomal-protein-alanine acetyltransferase [Parcubacteria group bacterium GW2011_GWA2_31_28]|nr:MAG: Ribosomal-protein-alanine acetyltransferase [Parcubacteria group bacterium GW2011_GWA2_31_28]